MKHQILIMIAVCFGLFNASCLRSHETSFFSNFSIRQLVERSNSAAGLACDPMGGGGGGVGSRGGGIGFRRVHFNSRLSESVACRLKSNEAFDETRFFAALKLDVDHELHAAGAQITETGSSGDASFYFAYALKNVRGRVKVSGTRIGTDYYDVHADLDESGN